MRSRSPRFACGLFALAAVALGCGGRLDSVSVEGRRASDVGAGPGDSTASPGTSAGDSPSPPGDCSTLGAKCQIFEPGGPERWGCHTVGTEPELACERAPGAAVARCNRRGHFGDDPGPIPHAEAGVIPRIDWFEIPATGAMPSTSEIVQLWRDRCDGRCVVRPPPPPPFGGDGG